MVDRWIPAHQLARLLGDAPWRTPRYRDLADRLQLVIVDGRVPDGARLPSERDLAAELGLSRTTITSAYSLLVERDHLRPRQGAGHFVSLGDAETASPFLPNAGPDPRGRIGLTAAAASAPPHLLDASRAAVEQLATLTGVTGYFPDGLPVLREALAARFAARGLPTTPDQIIVTNGALSALHICAHTFGRAGGSTITETVTYGNTLRMLRTARHRLHGIEVSADGWDHDSIRTTFAQARAGVAIVCPDFHNPTGALMREATRAHLTASALAAGTRLVVDETLVDLGIDVDPFGDEMPAPVATHSPEVVTVGSASKSFWGGLRLGWIRAPRALVRPLLETRATSDHGAPVLEQLVLTQLLEHHREVVEWQRRRVVGQRAHLLGLLAEHLPHWRCRPPLGGQALWCELPRPLSSALALRARDLGVLITPGPHFVAHGGGDRWVRLPFTAAPSVLDTAVETLARAWEQVTSGTTSRTGSEPAPFTA